MLDQQCSNVAAVVEIITRSILRDELRIDRYLRCGQVLVD
jgi:hypothetical protein